MVDEHGNKVQVIEHIILKNFWEYYVLKAHTNRKNVKLCFVLGDENEMGDVDMNEIAPYIISRTTNLEEVMPATGWRWA